MRWYEKYQKYFLTGDWHVHTNYTDGKNTVFEYVKKAEENSLDLIAFTEHVRRNLTYRFEDFISDIYSARDRSDIEILIGCEAKVLDYNGTLDIPPGILKDCEVVLGTFHSFRSTNKSDYLIALKNMLKNKYLNIWAHPTLFAKKNGIVMSEIEKVEIIELCKDNDIILEKNFKYSLPDEQFLNIALDKGCNIVLGSDAHETGELLSL